MWHFCLGHLRVLIDQLKDREQREWYLHAAVEYGWSRNVLVLQIKSGLLERERKAITNFQRSFPPPDSDLAEQVLKDPYNFDFLTVTREAQEREIERGLLIHLRDLLLELGRGFAFVGSQVPLDVGDETFYIELLFYHVRLHAYFVIERLCNRPHKSSMRIKQLEGFKNFNGKMKNDPNIACDEFLLAWILGNPGSRLDNISKLSEPANANLGDEMDNLEANPLAFIPNVLSVDYHERARVTDTAIEMNKRLTTP